MLGGKKSVGTYIVAKGGRMRRLVSRVMDGPLQLRDETDES